MCGRVHDTNCNCAAEYLILVCFICDIINLLWCNNFDLFFWIVKQCFFFKKIILYNITKLQYSNTVQRSSQMNAVITWIYPSLVFQSLAINLGCVYQPLSHNVYVNLRKMFGISFSKQIVNGWQRVTIGTGFSWTKDILVKASPLLGGAALTLMVLVCTDFWKLEATDLCSLSIENPPSNTDYPWIAACISTLIFVLLSSSYFVWLTLWIFMNCAPNVTFVR